MKLVSKAFRRTDWYVTSKFGKRIHPIDKVEKMHYGTDYGTNGKNWTLYAIEDGYVQKVVTGQNKAKKGYGNYVWIRYPRINISILYAHMSTVKVKKGDKVKEGTVVGTTGTTGASTGVHLHMGMTKIGSDKYLDPHAYNYEEPKPEPKPTVVEYVVKKGDTLSSIAKKYKTTWKKLYELNKTVIDSTAKKHGQITKFYNHIYIGTKLRIK